MDYTEHEKPAQGLTTKGGFTVISPGLRPTTFSLTEDSMDLKDFGRLSYIFDTQQNNERRRPMSQINVIKSTGLTAQIRKNMIDRLSRETTTMEWTGYCKNAGKMTHGCHPRNRSSEKVQGEEMEKDNQRDRFLLKGDNQTRGSPSFAIKKAGGNRLVVAVNVSRRKWFKFLAQWSPNSWSASLKAGNEASI